MPKTRPKRKQTSPIGNPADANFVVQSQNTFLVNVRWTLGDFLVVGENERNHEELYQRTEEGKKKVCSNKDHERRSTGI